MGRPYSPSSRRATVSALLAMALGVGLTASGGGQAGLERSPRRDVSPAPHPGDDPRMSGMGRLAHRAASGELKKKVQQALDARLHDAVHGDEEDGPAGGQAETSIAVDSSGQHIVVGVNDTRGFTSNPTSVSGFLYSDDGGATFVDGGQLPVTTGTSAIGSTLYPQVFGDPDVKYAGGSTFLYFSIILKKFSSTGAAQSLGVHRSFDNGHHWEGPFEIGPATNPNGQVSGGSAVDAADKEFADVDPDTGRVLMSWTNFTTFAPAGVEISTTFSDNVTTATPPTWSARVIVSKTSVDGQASQPRFAGHGSSNVYVAWRRFSGSTGQNVGFARSTNDGTTFPTVLDIAPATFFTMDQVLGNDRNNTSPSLAVDNSLGPHGGEIYIVYANNDNNDGADIVVQTSSNQGTSFTAPLKINSRVGGDRAQWIPWVTVDPSSGRAYVFYYDQGIAADGDLTETTYQFSDDGGVTWTRPAPLTDRPFHAAYGNDTGQPNLGDYNQAIAQGGEFFAVWAGTPPLVGFADGFPSNMTVPDMYFKRTSGAPRLAVSLGAAAFTDSGPNELGGNGVIDPGEQISLTIPLKNYVTNAAAGAGSVTGINTTLTTATAGVLVLQGASSYPNVAAGGSATNAAAFTLSIGAGFTPGTHIDLTLAVTSAQGATSLPFTLATGSPLATTLLSENFDGGVPGWVTQHVGGNNTVPWAIGNQSLGASPSTISPAAFHANANDGLAGNHTRWEELLSPEFTVPAASEYVTVDFDAAYDTEDEPLFNVQAYDGFLLRLLDTTQAPTTSRSVAAEAFAESFQTGAANFYPKHMPRSGNTNYLQDLSAWAGDSGGYRHVHLKFPGMTGRKAQLVFEFTQDNVWTCANLRPGHTCGVLVDNVVVQSVVSRAPTTIALTVSTNPTLAGQAVTFAATVTTTGGLFATDGSVTFKEGATVLQGPTPLSNGQAAFTTSALSLGAHAITASYTSSTLLFGASGASLVEQVVNQPTIAIADVSVTEGNSGTTPAQFHVTLSNGSSAVVSVSYATADQTATAPTDYAAASGIVSFQPGEVDKIVSVLVNGDTVVEPDETFLVNLSAPVNATIARGQAVGTIVDDEVNSANVTQAVAAGASRLQALQNPDGGWYFQVGSTSCISGPGVSCSNTVGITALGLLAGYTRTGNASYLTSATAAGNDLVALYNAAILRTPQGLPYYQDIEFLVELGQLTGNATYTSTAQAWFNVVVGQYPNAADRVDAMFASRDRQGLRTVAAWDVASLIRSAKAVGNVNYAGAAASRVVAREADWKDTDVSHRFDQCAPSMQCGPADNPYSYDYTIAAEGSLLWAFHDLPGFDAQIGEYRGFLLASADAQGSWDVGDSQITAYVMYGLAAVGGPGADIAMKGAGAFYVANQLPSGGWPSYVGPDGSGPEYAEIDAEVSRAVQTLFSTPAGSNVSVTPAQLATLTFSTVTAPGLTSVVAINQSAVTTVAGGFSVVGGLTYEVQTTAAIAGNITVCFTVPWITDAATFANVRVLHAEGGVLVDRTILPPASPAPDFASRRVCGLTTSLSPFAIALSATDTTPPSMTVTLTPSVLWPPDGRLVTVTAAIEVSDDSDPSPAVQLVSITSSEPPDGRDIQGAAFGTDDRRFRLRAEPPRHGRPLVYTVVYRATDRSGNTRDVSVALVVAHATGGRSGR